MDFMDGRLPTELKSSEKSAVFSEKRIGGKAGAMKVEWETCCTGDDSVSSEPLSSCDRDISKSVSLLSTKVSLSSFGGGTGGSESRIWDRCASLSFSASVSVSLS